MKCRYANEAAQLMARLQAESGEKSSDGSGV